MNDKTEAELKSRVSYLEERCGKLMRTNTALRKKLKECRNQQETPGRCDKTVDWVGDESK